MIEGQKNAEATRRVVASMLGGIVAVIGVWWGIETWVNGRIAGQVGPVQDQLKTVARKVDRNTALANQNNGMLRAIAGRLGGIDVPPPLPSPTPGVGQ